MKLKLLLSSALFLACFSAKANTVTINALNMSFSPANVTLTLGDTIRFVYVSGTDHTTTSVSVPAGATAWDAPLTSSVSEYIYVPAVAGNYTYVCTPHAPGMAGAFTVTAPTSVSDLAAVNDVFAISPNPATGVATLTFKNDKLSASVSVTDITGREVWAGTVRSGKTEIQTESFNNGLYLVRLNLDGKIYVRKLSVKH